MLAYLSTPDGGLKRDRPIAQRAHLSELARTELTGRNVQILVELTGTAIKTVK
jgi:hypothetical protein